ncbi:type II secretion system protein [Ruminococcus sp. HUN007]|uniref:type II secretion system protein n=1 Tax=Ruminococcus sp. HUN007 TaxID=1514668 RepID=UPI00067976DD|nr:type II secretion system protein [Ruminococcus sp. HUN007]
MKKFMGKTMAKMNENRRNGRRALKGFTLVEIIVVLVILAILAAAMIPALTGYIDKAKERTAVAEARNVLTAAQTLASEEYGLHGTDGLKSGTSTTDKAFAKDFGNKILTLADVDTTKAKLDEVTFDDDSKAKIIEIKYTTASNVQVYYKDGEFFVGKEANDEGYTAPAAPANP